MKSLKEMISESNSTYENYDEVVELAKTNSTFKTIKSRGSKTFEITFNNNIVLRVKFLGRSECFYSFLQNGEELYGINSSTFAEKVDWETLINNPKVWCELKIAEFQKGLQATERKVQSAYSKYERTRKTSDGDNWAGWQSFARGLEMSIDNLKKIMSML